MDNSISLSEEYQPNHRSWSNVRGHGNIHVANEQGFRIAPFNKLAALSEPTATGVTRELAWTQTQIQSCKLPSDNAPRVPMRSIDFDLSKFNCLG